MDYGDHAQTRPVRDSETLDAALEFIDGSIFSGISFGAEGKSVAGECVFQTGNVQTRVPSFLPSFFFTRIFLVQIGLVGYTESLTDPSYEGQILVLTYPLIGNYGVPERPTSYDTIPPHFESSRIHVAALVVGHYSEDFSHFLAASSLGTWLKESGVPAMYGVDTRSLTKKIREKGSMLGRFLARNPDSLIENNSQPPVVELPKLSPTSSRLTSPLTHWRDDYINVPFRDTNECNLVAAVSIDAPRLYKPTAAPRLHPSGRPLRVLAIDVGMKYNQIRCFMGRGVEVLVVPWDYDFLSETEPYDGLFVSNGP